MQRILSLPCFIFLSVLLSSCSYHATSQPTMATASAMPPPPVANKPPVNYAARVPQQIPSLGEKAVIVYPKVHAWGAYSADGSLVRGGIATAGSHWCADIKRPCRTKVGSFRVQSLGSPSCKSSIYPLPRGGAPMPYCMFFNGNQGLHGSYNVVDANASHGCVRLKVNDAEWLRYNFIRVGTKVIVRPYN